MTDEETIASLRMQLSEALLENWRLKRMQSYPRFVIKRTVDEDLRDIELMSQLPDMPGQVLHFPTCRHDDQVDAFAYAMQMIPRPDLDDARPCRWWSPLSWVRRYVLWFRELRCDEDKLDRTRHWWTDFLRGYHHLSDQTMEQQLAGQAFPFPNPFAGLGGMVARAADVADVHQQDQINKALRAQQQNMANFYGPSDPEEQAAIQRRIDRKAFGFDCIETEKIEKP